MSELKHMHAKTECLPFNTEDVRLIITERYGKQEIRMHGEDARFIVEAIAAAKRRTQPEATKPAQDLGAAILALPLPTPDVEDGMFANLSSWEREVFVRGALAMRKSAAAALASPADALVAGDSDTDLLNWLEQPDPQGRYYNYDHIGAEVNKGFSHSMHTPFVKDLRIAIRAAIQAQKDGHD